MLATIRRSRGGDNAAGPGSCQNGARAEAVRGRALPERSRMGDGACGTCTAALPSGARFCPQCGARVAVAPPPAAGERRTVAILFADLAGFTRLTSESDAEAIHRLLGRYFDLVDGAIARAGGTVDKHIGDATMAVFGAPVAHGNDIERAVRAAFEIHDAMELLSRETGRTLAAHVGIASGEVVAASTGSAVRADYTVTGDAVNLASRLEDLAEPGETIVSDEVREALGSRLDVEARGTLAVRGFAREMRVWRARALNAAPTARHAMVGRPAERARVEAAIAAARAPRTGRAFVVRGDPGVGKSLFGEAMLAAAAEAGCACHVASVLDFGAERGRDAASVLARSLLGVAVAADAETCLAAWTAARASGAFADADDPFVADLLGLPPPPGSRYDAMDPATRARGRVNALAALVGRAAAARPVAILVEDLHWADRPVIDAIAAIAAVAAERAVVLLATTRREGDPVTGRWPPELAETIELDPLSTDEALEVARRFLDARPEVARRCVERAQGNPLFLIQLLQSGADGEAVPGTIRNVVLARLDRLPAAEKTALQAASVVGQRFDPALVAHLVGSPVPFAQARARDLVRDAETPGELAFTHALIRDGAYASLLHSARRDLHRRAAAWYAERDPALHAAHLDRAEDPGAAEAYLAAARAAALAWQHDRALALVRRGAELPASPSMRHALAAFEGEVARDVGDAPASAAAFARALEHASTDDERCEAWIGVGAAHRLTSAFGPGQAALDAAEALAVQSASPRALARIAYLRGCLAFARGDTAGCAREHRRALDQARIAGDEASQAQAHSGIADVLYADGRMASAHDAFARCVALYDRMGELRDSLTNRCMIAITAGYLCRLDLARAAIDEARDAARAIGHRVAEVMADECAGLVFVDAGRFDEAREPLARSLALARRIDSRRFAAIDLMLLARIARDDGDIDAMERHLAESRALCETIGMKFAGGLLFGTEAIVARDAAARDAAIARGEALLREAPMAHNHFWFRRDAIRASLDAADWDGATRHAGELEAKVEAETLPWSTFHVAFGRVLVRAGRGVATRSELEDLRDRARAWQRAAELPAIERALGALPS